MDAIEILQAKKKDLANQLKNQRETRSQAEAAYQQAEQQIVAISGAMVVIDQLIAEIKNQPEEK